MGKPFIETLEALREGAVSTQLDGNLKDLIASVRATGKKGAVTIKVTVEPMKNAEPHMLLIDADVKLTLPQISHAKTFMYATEQNALTRRDPRQPDLPLAEPKPREVRSFPAQTAAASE